MSLIIQEEISTEFIVVDTVFLRKWNYNIL